MYLDRSKEGIGSVVVVTSPPSAAASAALLRSGQLRSWRRLLSTSERVVSSRPRPDEEGEERSKLGLEGWSASEKLRAKNHQDLLMQQQTFLSCLMMANVLCLAKKRSVSFTLPWA